MAAAETRSEESGIFWINYTSEEEQSVVLVPGVSRDTKFGIARSSDKVTKTRDTRDCKKSARTERPQRHRVSPSLTVTAQDLLQPHTAVPMKQATPAYCDKAIPLSQPQATRTQTSLKDLCPEDKRRIANLIEELARVSEEKDESVQRLRDEQETFERKIQQLEQQNVLIVHERESLQQQYKECQELLGLYQQYLSQQQEKLNQSIAELHSKVTASEAGPRRTSGGSPPDGARSGPGPDRGAEGRPRPRRRDSGGPRVTRTPSDRTDPPSSSSSSGEGGPAQPRAKHRSAQRGGEGRSAAGATGSAGPRRGPPDRSRPTDAEAEARAALTDPLLGHEDWEEKRHQLLLQKLQLEAERERLRARLAEQEQRLARQGQQLRQSRLDYSRLQHAAQVESARSVTGSGASPSKRPSNRRLLFSECEDAEAAEHLWSREPPQTSAGALQTELSTREAPRCSRQDAATSPVTVLASAPEPRPVSAPAVPPKTPEARSESSLLQLLGVLSPVSLAPRRPSSHVRQLDATAPHAALKQGTAGPAAAAAASYASSFSRGGGVPRASLSSCSSARFTQNPQQDLEESQILEDIFFIC